jgi:hypothetical protein
MPKKIMAKKPIASVEQIESRIFLIRGHCERVEPKAPGTVGVPLAGRRLCWMLIWRNSTVWKSEP